MPVRAQSLLNYAIHHNLPPSLCNVHKILTFPPLRFDRLLRRASPRVLVTRLVEKSYRSYVSCTKRNADLNRIAAKNLDFDAHNSNEVKKRKVVEHIFLMKMKSDLSEDEEKDMLDFLYTSQYQMRGILSISLGPVADQNVDGYTHAVYMRFQKKEDLHKFYDNPYYLGVLKDHVMPYCYGSISVDYESEVEDDILPIFRRGEEFNYGVEYVLLISMLGSATEDATRDAFTTLHQLTLDFEPLIVQATQGLNFNHTGSEFSHCAIMRFPSLEALEMFRSCSEFKDMWRWKFQPVIKRSLEVHFTVDPIGTDLM